METKLNSLFRIQDGRCLHQAREIGTIHCRPWEKALESRSRIRNGRCFHQAHKKPPSSRLLETKLKGVSSVRSGRQTYQDREQDTVRGAMSASSPRGRCCPGGRRLRTSQPFQDPVQATNTSSPCRIWRIRYWLLILIFTLEQRLDSARHRTCYISSSRSFPSCTELTYAIHPGFRSSRRRWRLPIQEGVSLHVFASAAAPSRLTEAVPRC